MVPYADFQLLKFPDKEKAMEKILALTMLSDIFPTGYHGAVSAGVRLGWAKSHTFVTGQTPVMKYNRELMMAIMNGRAEISKVVNATLISLNEAPQAYQEFDRGVSRKFVIDPHGLVLNEVIAVSGKPDGGRDQR